MSILELVERTGLADAAGLPAGERDALARAIALTFAGRVDDLPPASERRWWRIVDTDSFDAWLIDWPPGTGVDRHDHAGSAASLTVLRGRLLEESFQDDPTPVVAVLRPGLIHRVPARSSHRVRNVADAAATSVHVYSPPLRAMGFYESGSAPQVQPVDRDPTLWSTLLP